MAKNKVQECLLDSGLTQLEVESLLGEEAADLSDISPRKVYRAIEEARAANDVAAMQTIKNAANRQLVSNYEGNRVQALTAILVNDLRGRFGGISIERKAITLSSMANSEIIRFMEGMETSKLQLFNGIFTNTSHTAKQNQMLRNVVRETMGESTGNPEAKTFADSIFKVLDKLHVRYMEAGGKKGALEDFGLPQKHDPVKIREMTEQEWIEYTWPKLNIEKMIDLTEMNTSELREQMSRTYTSIITEGAARIGESPTARFVGEATSPASLSLDTRNRFLKFRNADEWLEYQGRFGSENVYMSIVDHINNKSREITLMETLGPDYSQGYAYLRNLALQDTREKKLGKGEVQITERDLGLTDAYFREIKGRSAESNSSVVKAITAIKNWEISTKLGGATLSAMSDFGFSPIVKHMNGMGNSLGLAKYLRQISSDEGRRFAARMGLGADHAISRTVSALEHQAEMGAGRARSAAEFTMRLSGLTAHTVAARQSFGLDFNSHVKRLTKEGWDKAGASKAAFSRYGITEQDFKALGEAKTESYGGEEFIDPSVLSPGLQVRFIGMIQEETDFAIPTPGVRERVITSLATDPNTVAGAAVRAGTQFMSFPTTIITKHWGRALNDAHIESRASYIAASIAMTTVLGAVAHMAKEVAAGREINEDYLQSSDFWLRATLQGGYFPIVGDLMLKETGWRDTWSAPLTDGMMRDLLGVLVFGNIAKMANADTVDEYMKEQKVGKEVTDFLKKNMPGQNVWYTRLAMERLITDKIRTFADPEFKRNARKKERQLYKEEGRRNWW